MSKAEKTRQFIIESTAELFNKKGYAGTSLAHMSEATGLTKGSIYGNFANKDDVAKEVFLYNAKCLQSAIDDKLNFKMTTKEKLNAFLDYYRVSWSHNFSQGGCPIMNTAIEADDTMPVLKAEATKSFAAWSDKIAGILEDGKIKSEVREHINSSEYSYLFIMLIEGGILLSKTTNNRDHLYNALERITKIINTEIIK